MHGEQVYKQCVDCIANTKELFSYYHKYNACFSIGIFDAEIKEICLKIARTYAKLILRVDNEIGLNELMLLQKNNQVVYLADEDNPCIHQIMSLMDLHKKSIIHLFENEGERRNLTDIADFEECLADAKTLIKKMELMILNSQRINQYYLKALA